MSKVTAETIEPITMAELAERMGNHNARDGYPVIELTPTIAIVLTHAMKAIVDIINDRLGQVSEILNARANNAK